MKQFLISFSIISTQLLRVLVYIVSIMTLASLVRGFTGDLPEDKTRLVMLAVGVAAFISGSYYLPIALKAKWPREVEVARRLATKVSAAYGWIALAIVIIGIIILITLLHSD